MTDKKFLRIWSHLLKKSLMENLLLYYHYYYYYYYYFYYYNYHYYTLFILGKYKYKTMQEEVENNM